MQELIVGLIVLACALYAVWALIPRSWRQACAHVALGWRAVSAFAPLRRMLEKQLAGGGGCSGCDAGAAPRKAAGAAQPVRIYRRRANSSGR